MLLANVLLLGSATLAAASVPINVFKRADNSSFPLSAIPSSCDTQCETYKSIFGTCPGNPSDSACAGACNGTILTNLQVCINCTQIDGLAAGTVTQYQIDILNAAQQQLAQACVEDGFPSSFTGAVPTPTTVTYPSGVDQATYASNSTSTTSSAASTTSASANSTAAATSAASSETGKASGARALSASVAGAILAAAGVAILL
ncbi:uncharacterized protein EHS24_001665 [Apiotrichum porosum]|uniref:Extracellular membrane protein CFEM domain-containing protein n=1 Tax=Apiotrichum porosum TaxID=105984 RepID=A0A427XIN5_9TREE|nr:uncharacterized protein EHS24_001665 [Apiotrichum porosum]RSH78759.1 hypothetical protein EHS24_001665 [Apiotrichum porosum]